MRISIGTDICHTFIYLLFKCVQIYAESAAIEMY